MLFYLSSDAKNVPSCNDLDDLDLKCKEQVSDSETNSGMEEDSIEKRAFPQQRFSPVVKPSMTSDVTHKPKPIKIRPELLQPVPCSSDLRSRSMSREASREDDVGMSPRPMTSGQLAFHPKGAIFKAHTPKAKMDTMVALDGEPARQSSLINFGVSHSNSNIISTKVMMGQTVQNFTLAPSVSKRNLSVSGIQVLNEMQDVQFIGGRSVDDGRLAAQKQYFMVSPKIAVPSSAGIKILNNNPVPIASKPPTPASMATKPPASVGLASSPNLLEQASQFATNNKSPICNSFGTVILPSSAANAALKSIGMTSVSLPGNFSIVAAACSRALEQQGSSVVFSSASDFQQMFPPYMANIVLKSTTPTSGTVAAGHPIHLAPIQALQMVQTSQGNQLFSLDPSAVQPATPTQLQYVLPSFFSSSDSAKVIPLSPALSGANASSTYRFFSTNKNQAGASGSASISSPARGPLRLAMPAAMPSQQSQSFMSSPQIQPQASPIQAIPFLAAGSQILMLNQPTVVSLAGGQHIQLAQVAPPTGGVQRAPKQQLVTSTGAER